MYIHVFQNHKADFYIIFFIKRKRNNYLNYLMRNVENNNSGSPVSGHVRLLESGQDKTGQDCCDPKLDNVHL